MKRYLQNFFEWVSQELESLETRWLVFGITVFLMLILRALGAQGLADTLGLFYIMYFLTFWRRS